MLSKELLNKALLSKVLKQEVKYFFFNEFDNEIKYSTIYSDSEIKKLEEEEDYYPELDAINIYELAHKCKEWALSKGYYLRAEQGSNYKDNLQWVCFLNKDMNDGADFIDYWNLTEPEAIFKATSYIMEQLK